MGIGLIQLCRRCLWFFCASARCFCRTLNAEFRLGVCPVGPSSGKKKGPTPHYHRGELVLWQIRIICARFEFECKLWICKCVFKTWQAEYDSWKEGGCLLVGVFGGIFHLFFFKVLGTIDGVTEENGWRTKVFTSVRRNILIWFSLIIQKKPNNKQGKWNGFDTKWCLFIWIFIDAPTCIKIHRQWPQHPLIIDQLKMQPFCTNLSVFNS